MSTNKSSALCENHPQMTAVASCAVCGKPVCNDCAVKENGRYFCDESSHRRVFDRYTMLGQSQTMFEAELVAKNLTANNISTLWFNRRWYGSDEKPVVFVDHDAVRQAHEILHALDLLDFIILEHHDR